jgi:hypothetical protein
LPAANAVQSDEGQGVRLDVRAQPWGILFAQLSTFAVFAFLLSDVAAEFDTVLPATYEAHSRRRK